MPRHTFALCKPKWSIKLKFGVAHYHSEGWKDGSILTTEKIQGLGSKMLDTQPVYTLLSIYLYWTLVASLNTIYQSFDANLRFELASEPLCFAAAAAAAFLCICAFTSKRNTWASSKWGLVAFFTLSIQARILSWPPRNLFRISSPRACKPCVNTAVKHIISQSLQSKEEIAF